MRRGGSLVAASWLALLAAGCSSDVSLFRGDWNWWSSRGGSAAVVQAAPPEGLVNPDGSCVASTAQPRGIALGMTECELVTAAGATGQIAISADERGERLVVITYPQGERAGIYRFASGLLVTIDRVEPAAPQRKQPKKQKPPPQRS